MIDPVEGIANTKSLNQSAGVHKASNHVRQQSAISDTVKISDTAKAALDETMDTPGKIVIKAKCGDLEAQGLLKQQATKKEMLGI
ncbi:MAG: hypothetical protein AB7Y74_12370 [Syntrophorhabdus sp.]|jgi:hypothetical protein